MDTKKRCEWVLLSDPLYVDYHDKEWGVLDRSDRRHFEMLVLETAQAGLSWRTVLHKRVHYRAALDDFDYEQVAGYSEAKLTALMENKGIIRNRLKIHAIVRNAGIFCTIRAQFGSFDAYLWDFIGQKPVINAWQSLADIPSQSEASVRLSKDLRQRGMKFVGPVVMYAHMQAVGLVQDHQVDCFRYQPLVAAAKQFSR